MSTDAQATVIAGIEVNFISDLSKGGLLMIRVVRNLSLYLLVGAQIRAVPA